MTSILLHMFRLFPFLCGGHHQLAVENLALRYQVAVYKRIATRPRPDRDFGAAPFDLGECRPSQPCPLGVSVRRGSASPLRYDPLNAAWAVSSNTVCV